MLRPAHLLRNEKLTASLAENPVPLVLLICLAWTLLGLVGHDPWKPDEAHTFGVVYQLMQSGDWVVPMLAGEPFMEKPPMIYMTAALFGAVFSPVLPLHDATRLVAGAFMGVTLFFTALTAKELYGGNKTWMAALMLLGCGGLLVRGHQLISDVALLAGLAIGLYALALSVRRPMLAGFCLGNGLGIMFLSTGLVEPLMLLLTMVLLPVVSTHWRTRAYTLTMLVALVFLLPWASIWPSALYSRSPELFAQWFWTENVLRLRGMFSFNAPERYSYYLNVLPWFAWPALPFALWTLWSEGLAGLRKPGILLPLVAFAVFFAFLSLIAEGRDVLGLPLLLPLSLLAAACFVTLRRGATNAYYWFSIMLFTFFILVAWFYWMAIEYSIPARLGAHMMKLQPEYQAHTHPLVILVAFVFTAAWFVLLFNVRRSPERPVIIWAAGVTVVWTLVALLLVNYIDTGKSYRSMVAKLSKAIPEGHRCIYSQSVSEPQRAMLHYFANIITVRLEKSGPRPDCDLLITQDNWDDAGQAGGPWEMIWEGRRPGDKEERYRLYRQP
ncbi:MAG TPA: glycosyltransferase family 39 protein [Burkholderiales bacterium]|nr:glycosyltransferase family 39 protein [Burkholderiales bacterium]